jgi:hypothetical protein
MPCSGEAGETCGGADRLNVYAAGPAWVQLGCYSDQTYSRTLTTVGTYSGLLTIEKCLASCAAAGFVYAGMEYSEECHCGNTFSNGGGPAPDGNAGCTWTCNGNTTELCGGNSRLSMYEYINAAGVVASATAAATSTTATPTASVPSSTTIPVTLPTGWSYAGCYVDGAQGRIFSTQEPDSSSNTIESCIATCSSLGYTIAGLEYSSQCFCDNFIRNAGALAASDSACAMTCSGNSGEICGGPDLLSVYSIGTPEFAIVPTVKKTDLPSTWAYSGCYTDSIGVRDTGDTGMEVDSSTLMTAEYCLELCQTAGFNAGGTEYSSQCCKLAPFHLKLVISFVENSLSDNLIVCGTQATFATVAPALLSDSSCNMVCSGNSTQLCGGAGAISFYTLM